MPFLAFDREKSTEITGLVTQAQLGDTISLNRFLDCLQPKLVQYFEACGFGSDAEDLAQSALVSIARAVVRITPATAIGYVARVAQRLAHKAAQREHELTARYGSFDEATDVPATTDTEAILDEVEAREIVMQTCQMVLTPEQQLVMLESLAGYTPSDIAERWGIDPGTVRTRLLRARRLLSDALNTRSAEPHP